MARRPQACVHLLFALSLVVTCKPDRQAFSERTFFCDAATHRTECGTTEAGTALTCFGGQQLGAGRDFCVEPCLPDPAAPDSVDRVCLTGAKLRTCRPSEKTAEDPDGCGEKLGCLRTDLTRDEGVCLAMKVCSSDGDCDDPALPTCGSTVLKALLPNAPFTTTNLQCVVGGCKAGKTSCPLGETCLPSVAPSTTAVPDLCVPSCDSQLNCPPNYACWRRVSGAGAPTVCIPTLPGARCTTALDCWAGDCLDTGEGFSLCALPCARDEDCVPISSPSRRQYCVPARGDKKYCMAASPFGGSLCLDDAHCPAGQRCYFNSPFWRDRTPLGECRPPCGDGDSCAVRGGIPHACFVWGSDRSCYPGVLGTTCRRSEECLAGRTCESVPPEDVAPAVDAGAPGGPEANAPRICTRPCTTDVDCLDVWDEQEGYCAAGWCRLALGMGSPCTRLQMCRDQHCQGASPGTPGTCSPAPAPAPRP